MLTILPKPTLTTLRINRNQLSLDTNPVVIRVPVDSVFAWATISSTGAVSGALSSAIVGLYLDQQIVSIGAVPSANLIWGKTYQATTATAVEQSFSDSLYVDFKACFVKSNTPVSLQVVGSGTFTADVNVVIASYSTRELKNFVTNPI